MEWKKGKKGKRCADLCALVRERTVASDGRKGKQHRRNGFCLFIGGYRINGERTRALQLVLGEKEDRACVSQIRGKKSSLGINSIF